MLNRLADMLYPNKCEIINIKNSYVYPIYKNGSSSIRAYTKLHSCKILINNQIAKINDIDVVLREPTSRFISGINKFVWNLKRENPYLDTKTILYFAENYLFLNRHYVPQISWLLHLSKYLNPNARLLIHNMSHISKLVETHIKPDSGEMVLADVDIERLQGNIHNTIFLKLDQLLLELVGQKITFNEILSYIKNKDPQAFKVLTCIALD